MRCEHRAEFLTDSNTEPIEQSIEKAKRYFGTNLSETGELIIDYLTSDGIWECLYKGTLDGGAGESCAASKVDTLIGHPEYDWGGSIPKDQLSKGENPSHGSIRLKRCHDLEDSGWNGELIIAFSGCGECQDIFYVASVIQILKNALLMDFELPEGIKNNPVWATALNTCSDTSYYK